MDFLKVQEEIEKQDKDIIWEANYEESTIDKVLYTYLPIGLGIAIVGMALVWLVAHGLLPDFGVFPM